MMTSSLIKPKTLEQQPLVYTTIISTTSDPGKRNPSATPDPRLNNDRKITRPPHSLEHQTHFNYRNKIISPYNSKTDKTYPVNKDQPPYLRSTGQTIFLSLIGLHSKETTNISPPTATMLSVPHKRKR